MLLSAQKCYLPPLGVPVVAQGPDTRPVSPAVPAAAVQATLASVPTLLALAGAVVTAAVLRTLISAQLRTNAEVLLGDP